MVGICVSHPSSKKTLDGWGTRSFLPSWVGEAGGRLASSPPASAPVLHPAPHTQPSRPPMLHRHRLPWNLGRRQQPHPVLLPAGPPEGHRPIMPYKPVPPHHPLHPPKHPATPLRPLQIID